MPSRQRSIEAGAGDALTQFNHTRLLGRIRNMWQFANLCQWIYLFGKVAKIEDSLDIEELETECLKPASTVLDDLAVALLKLISSHRGVTHQIFDDQARKQYANRDFLENPFGDDDVPLRFSEFDVLLKIKILQQFTQWAMTHPERIREKMDEQRDSEQTTWRIEPYGWDSKGRTYYVLDDNRIYRLTEDGSPRNTQRSSSKKATKAFRPGERRSSRRHRLMSPEKAALESEDESTHVDDEETPLAQDGLGGMAWECIAVKLEDVQHFLESIQKSRDQNERILHRQVKDHLVPILEKQEEARRRKEIQRERDLLNLAKIANAKRSSRIAGKRERQEEEDKAREEERLRRGEELVRRREAQKRVEVEEERDVRIHSREKRLAEREERRKTHQGELSQLTEGNHLVGNGSERISERHLEAERRRNEKSIQNMEDEDDDWIFDCICGLRGQIDDGSHSVACENCNVWQHSHCLGISEAEAERPDFHFVCTSCAPKEQVLDEHRAAIKIKLKHPGSSSLPAQDSKRSQLIDPAQKTSPRIELPSKHQSEITPLDAVGEREAEPRPLSTYRSSESQQVKTPSPDVTGAKVMQFSSATAASTNITKKEPFVNASTSQPITTGHETPAMPRTNGVPNLHNTSSPKFTPSEGVTHARSSPPLISYSPASGRRFNNGKQNSSTLSSPHISYEIHHSAQNGAVPSHAGYSPKKQSPEPHSSPSPGKIRFGATILPPAANLSPIPHETIMTPPVKPADPPRPHSSFRSFEGADSRAVSFSQLGEHET